LIKETKSPKDEAIVISFIFIVIGLLAIIGLKPWLSALANSLPNTFYELIED
jgi:hypothetical protein